MRLRDFSSLVVWSRVDGQIIVCNSPTKLSIMRICSNDIHVISDTGCWREVIGDIHAISRK